MIKDIEILKNYNGFGKSYYPGPYYDSFAVSSRVIAPKSRGSVRLNTIDPIWSQPKINLSYLTHPHDIKTIVKGALMTRKLFKTKTFRKGGITKYTIPAEGCKHFKFESTKYFECASKKYAMPISHVAGTCKMGPRNDSTAVIDSKLRVHGIHGLRVIDASIMPIITRGAVYGATIMIAEKGSDLIKKKWL